jgi:hypothetical protein
MSLGNDFLNRTPITQWITTMEKDSCSSYFSIEGGEIRENSRGKEFKYEILICCKSHYKCHNVPLPSTIK